MTYTVRTNKGDFEITASSISDARKLVEGYGLIVYAIIMSKNIQH